MTRGDFLAALGAGWRALRNPVLREDGCALKDPCFAAGDDGVGRWFFSRVRPDAAGDWRFALARCSGATVAGPGAPEVMAEVAASPNLSRVGGRWWLTYCDYGETQREVPPAAPNRLRYRTSDDLENWSAVAPLAPELSPGLRAIDPAVIEYAPGRLMLVWKERQTPSVALGRMEHGAPVAGSWRRLEAPTLPWFENAQLVAIDGANFMLATLHDKGAANSHVPGLCPFGVTEAGVSWGEFRRLEIPEEGWNTRERANAAFLHDNRAVDGWFYLASCGRSRGEWHSDGDYAIGLHRSRDLVRWFAAGSF